MVILAEIADWKLDDWLALAKTKSWETFKKIWKIPFQLKLIDIINYRNIKGLQVGSPTLLIEEKLGKRIFRSIIRFTNNT